MAVKLRLTRVGKKKQPTYRIVATDSRSPRDGRFIEILGHYNPRQEPSVLLVDNERAAYWLGVGAQPSERVGKLLTISGATAIAKGETPPAGYEQYDKAKQAEAAAAAEAAEAAEATA